MKKYVCPVCGYVYEGDELPEGFKCPICGVSGEKFQVVEGEMKLAAEHEFGIGTKLDGVPEEDKKFILDQLKANFSGECSEVGMYLCMARIAHREGYPEIGLYWEKAAYEEAEHAAKFAELLGSELEPNMTASTKKNLAWRVECEFGATAQVFYLEGQPGPVVRGKTAALNLGLHGGAGGAVTKLRGLKRGCVRRRGWGTGGDKQGEKDGGREKTKTMSHIKAPFYGAGKMLLFFYSHRAGKTDRICEKRGTIFQVCGNGRS